MSKYDVKIAREPEGKISGQWHNNLFKASFKSAEQVKPLLSLLMTPRQLKQFNLDTLEIQADILISSTDLKPKFTDLLVTAELKDGSEVTIDILVEHKNYPDSAVMGQLLQYIGRIYEKGAKVVVPIVLYHGQTPWKRKKSFLKFNHRWLPKRFLKVFGHTLVDFEAIFVKLRDAKTFKRLEELPWQVRLVLQVLARIWEADTEELASYMDELRAIRDPQAVKLAQHFTI